MDNFYAYIPLILKYIVILPYFLKDSKQVLKYYQQSQALDFTVDDIRAVGLDKLDNILQTEKKETENTLCRACYYKNKHSKNLFRIF
ncbi:hypothetical protein [Spiroplasma ixodetis]|uniref:Uncharacterized protein n=1 Tax=Spiroplasma ixodetis TaxID=2141 RepID=A0ABM8BUH4_9MOLU|nr:hypothetical protein [Spiroplasma ixodetis]BDT03474.1 hypothetical protein SHM_11200 [Spiroplasma ixodetis]